MSDAVRVQRQIGIQSGVVKRLTKEVGYYQKESAAEQATLEQWEANGTDEHKLRQQRTVFSQAQAMVPDTAQRLGSAATNLKTLLDNAGADPEVAKSTEATQAAELIQAAQTVLKEHAAGSD